MSFAELSSRHRVIAVPLLVALAAISVPVAAAGTPPPPPSSAPSPTGAAAQLQQAQQQAQQQLDQAQQDAAAEDTAVAQAQADLNAAEERLAALRLEIERLDPETAGDTATVPRLRRQADEDRASLAAFVRVAYEKGLDSSFTRALAADTLSSAVQREVAVSTVSEAMGAMVRRIAAEQDRAQRLLAEVVARRAQVAADREQTRSLLAVVQVEASRVQQAAYAAHQVVTSSQTSLADAVKAQQEYLAERAALLAARSRRDLIFPPVPGVVFGVDTDLTKPSGETAAGLDAFLRGTPLHDLGAPLLAAEGKYHVSARYLLAHAIEESAFGSSQIARGKHNLYGYGADDEHPYEDAKSFDSLPACIDFVAAKVAGDYLSPTGAYYHGPTLRGMNINYASDPLWAGNIAKIGNTFA
ncbi:MAG: hypothetical protein NVS3B18_00990 [Candidatus Dormibacteria bacterium]